MTLGLLSFASNFLPSFNGNNKSVISSISGSITTTRSSGTTPFFIQVSASGISCTGTRANGATAIPYEDIQYSWNFGDMNGTEVFNNVGTLGGNGTTTTTVNANTGQIAPEASYVYRAAGPYTITLTATWWNGNGFSSQTFTQSVSVTAFAATSGREMWFDSVNGSDSNNGTSPSTPKQTLPAIQTNISSYPGTSTTSGAVWCHLAQGSSWTGSIALPNPNVAGGPIQGLRIDSYVGSGGAGAAPTITANSTAAPLELGNPISGKARGDFVFSNLLLTNTTGATQTYVSGIISGNFGAGSYSDVYFDNCTLHNTLNTAQMMILSVNLSAATTATVVRWGVWGGSIFGDIFNSSPQTRHSIFGGPTDWFFVVGTAISGSGSNPTLDHHIYPEQNTHALYKWISFGTTGTAGTNSQRSYCININGNASSCQYFCISENLMQNTVRLHDLDGVLNDPTTILFSNVVCERNNITNLTGGSCLTFSGASTYTNRDNHIWNCAMGYFNPTSNLGSLLQSAIYRNKFYVESGNGAAAILQLSSGYNPYTFTPSSTTVSGLSGHSYFPVGLQLRLFSSGGTLPAPYASDPPGTVYFVTSTVVAGTSFTLSKTSGGAAITATTAGTGTLFIYPVWSQPQLWFSNQVNNQVTNGSVVSSVFGDIQTSGSYIDSNDWFVPNGSTPFAQNNLATITGETFSFWQGSPYLFDLNGSQTDPNFSNPSIGLF